MLIIILLLVIYVAWKLYESVYYKSEKFLFIKNRIQTYILNCNELNHHIEELKNTYIGINQLDYGKAVYTMKADGIISARN